jgi:hypothetical protein
MKNKHYFGGIAKRNAYFTISLLGDYNVKEQWFPKHGTHTIHITWELI